MKIVDYCKEFDERLWKKTVDKIAAGNDPLKENYLTLTPRDFICWPVLIDNDEIVCFSGLQFNPERWTTDYARINARMWIAPERRHRGPGKLTQSEKYLNTKYLVSIQLQYARSINLRGVFISREGNYRRGLQRYCDLVKANTGAEFSVLDGIYNVCGCLNPVPESCKQLIALHLFDGDTAAWHYAMSQYWIIE